MQIQLMSEITAVFHDECNKWLFYTSYSLYVTGSAKRYVVALTMIFLYKRCSKTRSIFYSLKTIFFGLAVSKELNALLTCQARCLKTAT